MLLQKHTKKLRVCDLLFRGSWNSVITYIGRVGYALNVNAYIWFLKLQVQFLFLSYFLYLHWIAVLLSTWAAARCSWIKPSRAPWGGSRGEQRRVHGHPHQGRHTSSAQHVMFYPFYVLCCFYFVLGIWKTLHGFCRHFMSGSCQIEKNPRDHQGHNGAPGTRAETDRQAVHHSDSRPCLSERGELGSGEPAKVQYTAGKGKSSPRGLHPSRVFYPTGRHTTFTWGLASLGESSFCLVGYKARLESDHQGLDFSISGIQNNGRFTEENMTNG